MQRFCNSCGLPLANAKVRSCTSCGHQAPQHGWPVDPVLGVVVDAGKYYVERLIGRGGFGKVYLVRHTMISEQTFAMKVLNPMSSAQDAEDEFLREVRVLLELDHPNIVRCHDVGRLQTGSLFLRMELVQGESLSNLLRRNGPMTPSDTALLGVQIADALATAHEANVLHRDLKPENVLLLPNGAVRLIDFGIAKVIGGSETQANLSRVIGTPLYMAPEQFRPGLAVDGRLDIYQLGAVLHFAATCQPPYPVPDDATPEQSVIAIAQAQERRQQDGPRPSSLRRELREQAPLLDAAVARMLSTNPSRRPTAVEAASLLGDLVPTGAYPSLRRTGRQSSDAVAVRPGRSPEAAHTDTFQTTPGHAPNTGPQAQPSAPAGHHSLGVMVFRNMGPPDDEYLAECLAEDVIDNLSNVGGVLVRPWGVAASLQGQDLSAQSAGEALGVHVVAQGSVRRVGEQIQVRCKLVSVADGFQLWARRFLTTPAEMLDLANDIAAAIAGELVGDDSCCPKPSVVPDADAMDLFLRGRHELRRNWMGDASTAIQLLGQALERAPDDPQILSTLATASARRAFSMGRRADLDRARELAGQAISAAPKRAEPQYAMALVEYTDCRAGPALTHLGDALRMSQAFAGSHDLLGRILVETGPAELGIHHLRKALELDPALSAARFDLARIYALLGQWEAMERMLALPPLPQAQDIELHWLFRSRFSLWRPDGELELDASGLDQTAHMAEGALLFLSVRGTRTFPTEARIKLLQRAAATENPRRRLVFYQIMAELSAYCGEDQECLQALEVAVGSGLLDMMWLSHCPLFERFQGEPRYVQARSQLQEVLAPIRASVPA